MCPETLIKVINNLQNKLLNMNDFYVSVTRIDSRLIIYFIYSSADYNLLTNYKDTVS